MTVQKSNFKLNNMFITKSIFEAIPKKKSDPKELSDLPVGIDYYIQKKQDSNTDFRVLFSVFSNNSENPEPGYKFSIQMEAYFSLTESVTEEQEVNKYILFSGLPMLINSARMYMMNLSTYGPYGKYLMPMVDMNKFIESRNEVENTQL